VSQALATLPWVEDSQIIPDKNTRKVAFGIKDKDKFNFDEVKAALRAKGSKYERGVELARKPG